MIKNTKIVRTLMQASGKNHVYTNKYRTCRTVKCYGTPDSNPTMIANIQHVLSNLRVPFSFTYTDGAGSYSGGPAIIVRLPL